VVNAPAEVRRRIPPKVFARLRGFGDAPRLEE
jgi:hypothetical protein